MDSDPLGFVKHRCLCTDSSLGLAASCSVWRFTTPECMKNTETSQVKPSLSITTATALDQTLSSLFCEQELLPQASPSSIVWGTLSFILKKKIMSFSCLQTSVNFHYPKDQIKILHHGPWHSLLSDMDLALQSHYPSFLSNTPSPSHTRLLHILHCAFSQPCVSESAAFSAWKWPPLPSTPGKCPLILKDQPEKLPPLWSLPWLSQWQWDAPSSGLSCSHLY